MILTPSPKQQFFGNNGRPLDGGLLFTYAAGTNNKIDTYSNASGTLNTNPIVLDFRGEANIWLDPELTYKFVLSPRGDTDPPTNPIWSVDNITPGLTSADITQQFIGRILWPRTQAEINADVTPTNYAIPPDPQIDPRRYGGGPDESASANDAALADALAVSVEQGGAEIILVVGVWSISATIVLEPGVFLLGEGPHTFYNAVGTSLKPTVGFTGTEVVRADSADTATVVMSGAGVSHLAFDMDNIAEGGVHCLVMRSVSNSRPIVNVNFFNHEVGNAIRIEKSAFPGALPSDGLDFFSCFTYGKGGNVVTQIPKLFVSGANEVAFRSCKFQTSDSVIVAGKSPVEVGSDVLGLTFSTCSFAGGEFGCVIRNPDDAGPAEHVRFLNNIFEGYRYGIYVRGPVSTADQNFWSKRVTVEPGNRFLTASGADPRNVIIDRAVGCIVWLDEFIAGGSGTPKLAELTAQATGNVIYAPPAQVVNAGPNNVVMGRSGTAMQVTGIFTEEGDFTLTNTAGITGAPTGTARYTKIGNNVTLFLPQIVGAASGTSVTFSGIPAVIRPVRNQWCAVLSADNTQDVAGMVRIASDGTMLLEAMIAGVMTPTFSNTGVQGLESSTVAYSLL
jgi:hypothetical protein